jgi:hypothetical protein
LTVDSSRDTPKELIGMMGRVVAALSVLWAVLAVFGPRTPSKDWSNSFDAVGVMVQLARAGLGFGSGLLMMAAAIAQEVRKLGAISQRSFRVMKIGFGIFFFGLLQYRLSNWSFAESLIFIASGMVLLGVGCAVNQANSKGRAGGIISVRCMFGGVLSVIVYEISSSNIVGFDDVFDLIFRLSLAAIGSGIGLFVGVRGLIKDGKSRPQPSESQ